MLARLYMCIEMGTLRILQVYVTPFRAAGQLHKRGPRIRECLDGNHRLQRDGVRTGARARRAHCRQLLHDWTGSDDVIGIDFIDDLNDFWGRLHVDIDCRTRGRGKREPVQDHIGICVWGCYQGGEGGC